LNERRQLLGIKVSSTIILNQSLDEQETSEITYSLYKLM